MDRKPSVEEAGAVPQHGAESHRGENLLLPHARPLPCISVIIPAWNEEHCIERCLKAIVAGSTPRSKYEIIVVDHNSSDRTKDIAALYADAVYVVENGTPGALRNYGAARCIGQMLAFIDADCVAASDWLEQGCSSLAKDECLTGSLYNTPENPSWLEKTWFCARPRGRKEVTYLATSNLFVKRPLFTRLGGFDPRLTSGEDSEFCCRARSLVRVISDDRIKVVHLSNPKTVAQFFRREIWHGMGALGSFRVSHFDKPLIGTVLFAGCLLAAAAGAAVWAAGKPPVLFLSGALAMLVLLAATALNRKRYWRSAWHGVSLMLLYGVYYTARLVSFFYIASGKRYYHKIKADQQDKQLRDGQSKQAS